MALNARQQRFIAEYLKKPNATAAAEAAGYSPRAAYSTGWKLVRKAEIAAEIAAKTATAGISVDRTLKEFAALGYSNVGEFFDESGKIKRLSELPESLQRSLVGVDVDEDGRPAKLRLGKVAGLEAIARHLRMFPGADANVVGAFQINIHMDLGDSSGPRDVNATTNSDETNE